MLCIKVKKNLKAIKLFLTIFFGLAISGVAIS